MRPLLALSALLVLATATPTIAQDYPWCARTKGNNIDGDCSFTSFQQCQATVSGQHGDCSANPRMAYGQSRRPYRGAPGWDNNHW
jgi:Protein of unknown function (DUF3551)